MEEGVRARAERAVPTWVRLGLVVLLLYLFLVGVKGLESGIGAFGADVSARVFGAVSSPLSALSAGILATVLVQSSSVSTATIVGLVGSGGLGLPAAIPMIMGANIGTTVTNTLASLGHLRRSREFRLAFAGATMHDFFNVLSVLVLLPLELATGFLSSAASWLTGLVEGRTGVARAAPSGSVVKDAVKAPIALLEDLLDAVAGSPIVTGVALLVIGLAGIFLALGYITRNMRLVMAGRLEHSLNRLLGRGAGVGAMALGMVITISVQSSSITTSVLIPMVAAGVLSLDNAYPVTLGANVGTTVTALLASIAADRPEALTVALTHTLFNLCGIVLLYPVPALRRIPLLLANRLAELAMARKPLVAAYVAGTFVVLPVVGILAF